MHRKIKLDLAISMSLFKYTFNWILMQFYSTYIYLIWCGEVNEYVLKRTVHNWTWFFVCFYKNALNQLWKSVSAILVLCKQWVISMRYIKNEGISILYFSINPLKIHWIKKSWKWKIHGKKHVKNDDLVPQSIIFPSHKMMWKCPISP